MKYKIISLAILIFGVVLNVFAQDTESKPKQSVLPSYAWTLIEPLGLRNESTIDTLFSNYHLRSVPSMSVSPAYATTGNLGAEGLNLIYFDRNATSDFFFQDALAAWMPTMYDMRFLNTRIPMTLLSYNTGGGRDNAQDRLSGTFSGNINKRAQVGAMLDYLYSKGSYNYQADKDLSWGFSGSYIGDRYEFQGYFNHYNFLNKENGGITDDLYITDPAEVQGGSSKVDTKTIPTNLSKSHSKIVSERLLLNNRYKVGFYKEEIIDDTTKVKTYVPVSSFIWTLKYDAAKHIFKNDVLNEDTEFWENRYLNANGTDDRTQYWALTNTFGISLLEGFNKYAKAGLAAYVTHQLRSYTQAPDSVTGNPSAPEGLNPNPFPDIKPNEKQNLVWVGAQLTKQHGTYLTYEATGEFGLVGPASGEVKLQGKINTHFPLFGDTVSLSAYGKFENIQAPYLYNNYVSNHYIWKNDFSKIRKFRVGGVLVIPFTNTKINAGVENVQNYIYFDKTCKPVQHGGSVQVFSVTLNQHLGYKAINWDNDITYQTSTDESVIPLPKLSIYSNLYLKFKVARVLDVQFGVDCSYYTKYKSVAYQPATMTFYNQDEIECGNYPFMNVYADMKLGKTRFYIMMSHISQGMVDKNYFSMPHYPLNPRRFQLGLSINFAN